MNESTPTLIRRFRLEDHSARKRRLRDRIASQNAGLVYKIARSFSPSPDDLDDLIQVGFIGLVKAIDRFEPDRDNAFSSFAVPKIRGEIQHYLRDNPTGGVIVSRGLHDDFRAVQNAAKKTKRSDDEVAIAYYLNKGYSLDAAQERWATVKDAAEQAPRVVRIDKLQIEYEAPRVPPYALLAQLPMHVVDVLILLGQGMSRTAVAEGLGLSLARVHEIAEGGIEKLKQLMEDVPHAC